MRILILTTAVCFGLCIGRAAKGGAAPQQDLRRETQTHISPQLSVLSAGWASLLPPAGRVNAPEFLTTAFPGQKLAIAVRAEGPDRDAILDGASAVVRISVGSQPPKEYFGIKPIAIRAIKAEGADFVVMALKAASLAKSEQDEMEKTTSLDTMAIFEPDWAVPALATGEEIVVTATISGQFTAVTTEPMTLKIRATEDWLNDAPPAEDELGHAMNRFHSDMPPGRVLALLRSIESNNAFNSGAVQGIFTFLLKYRPEIRAELIRVYPKLDARTQFALLRILKLADFDLAKTVPAATSDAIAQHKRVEALPDPRSLPKFVDPVDPSAVRQIGNQMDACWACWMATGDKTYLHALVNLLEGAPDFEALKKWQETKTGPKGLNAAVARGLAYQIAGWSIGSFEHTDPLVTDWMIHWENDRATPDRIRHEISTLLINPAFKKH